MVSFGVRLIRLAAQNAHELLLTVAFVAAILLFRTIAVHIVRALLRANANGQSSGYVRRRC